MKRKRGRPRTRLVVSVRECLGGVEAIARVPGGGRLVMSGYGSSTKESVLRRMVETLERYRLPYVRRAGR